MFFDLGLRAFNLCNISRWFVLLLITESAKASGGQTVDRVLLKPRLLPRDKLLRLPIAARDVGAELLTNSGNGTANATQLAPNLSAGISVISQGKDRQYVLLAMYLGHHAQVLIFFSLIGLSMRRLRLETSIFVW